MNEPLIQQPKTAEQTAEQTFRMGNALIKLASQDASPNGEYTNGYEKRPDGITMIKTQEGPGIARKNTQSQMLLTLASAASEVGTVHTVDTLVRHSDQRGDITSTHASVLTEGDARIQGGKLGKRVADPIYRLGKQLNVDLEPDKVAAERTKLATTFNKVRAHISSQPGVRERRSVRRAKMAALK